ncbi:Insulin-like growth factor-binding protein 4 [Saguinus oedipus]|uniref:Insulin-like growth factor-binding protein 4 n=1 Tax=Saguinus oedipus TaxID=9490 RepID=A0ABQ9VN23_SAGOE|nr:Insulin-like growth factor-binding protein 4 [Saguinus oedipus]
MEEPANSSGKKTLMQTRCNLCPAANIWNAGRGFALRAAKPEHVRGGSDLQRVLTSPYLGLTADKDEGDHPNSSFNPCSAHDRRCLQKHMAKIRDRSTNGGKMKVNGAPREEPRPLPQGACQSELQRALERLAASPSRTHEDLYIIPIPNCDRNGNFHPKQVPPAPCYPSLDGQRGKCWCVDRKTGVKLPEGSEPVGELDCQQLADSFQE